MDIRAYGLHMISIGIKIIIILYTPTTHATSGKFHKKYGVCVRSNPYRLGRLILPTLLSLVDKAGQKFQKA